MASYRRGYENNRQRNRAFPRPSGMSDPMQRLELMPDYQPMQPMPRPMEATPMPEGYKPIRPMPPRSYGDDVRNIPMPEPSMPESPGNFSPYRNLTAASGGKQYSDNPELNDLYNQLQMTIMSGGGVRMQTPEESAASSQKTKMLEQAIISAGGNPYEHFTRLPHGSFGKDGPEEGYDPMTGRTPEPMGPKAPHIEGPRGPMPPRPYDPQPRMPDQGRDEVGSDKMNRMMELLKRSAQPNADTQYTPPRPQSRLEEMSEKLNPGMHTQDTETTERVGREQREAEEFFRNNPNQQPISQSDRNLTPDIEMSTKQYKGPIISQAELEERSRYDVGLGQYDGPSKAEYDEMMLKYRDTRPLDVQRAENAERSQKRQDMISGMPDKYGKSYGAPTPPQMPQQMYSARPGEELEDYQDRVTSSQAADPNFNLALYQQQLRSGQGRQPQMPMMMSRGGSAWRGSLPQGYEADEDLRAQALADINAGADMDGDNLISDEELYNWRPSDSRYGTNPNNRVNRDQSYSQAALDTLRRKGAEMGDDGVFSEDEFWKFDAARQQNEGQNYGGATLEGEFNYQDPSTWNAPQPPMPMPEPMSPSQTTYVPEPAPNPYVFGGYGSPPPQYAGMNDPRMTNIVGMAPPSYYGGAEE